MIGQRLFPIYLTVYLTAIIVIFACAAKLWSNALVIFRQVFERLEAAAPNYDPSTFSIDEQLIPLLVPVIEAEVSANRFLRLYSVGFATWVAFDTIWLAGLSPFFYPHIKQLTTLWRRDPSSRMSLPGPPRDPSTSHSGVSMVKPSRVKRTEYMILSLASTTIYLAESIVIGGLVTKNFESSLDLRY